MPCHTKIVRQSEKTTSTYKEYVTKDADCVCECKEENKFIVHKSDIKSISGVDDHINHLKERH